MIVRSISTLLARDLCKVITMTDGSSALPRTEDNMANIRKHEDDVGVDNGECDVDLMKG